MGGYHDLPLLFDSDRTLHELKAVFDTLEHLGAWVNYISLDIGQDHTYFEIQYPAISSREVISWVREMENHGLKIDYDTMRWATGGGI